MSVHQAHDYTHFAHSHARQRPGVPAGPSPAAATFLATYELLVSDCEESCLESANFPCHCAALEHYPKTGAPGTSPAPLWGLRSGHFPS